MTLLVLILPLDNPLPPAPTLVFHPLLTTCFSPPRRFAGCPQVHHEGDGAPASDRAAPLLRHRDVCHHRAGVLHGEVSQNLLLQ